MNGMRLALLPLFLIAIVPALAQPRGGAPGTAISGSVVDSASGEPLRVATVSVHGERDSVLVSGALTERDGSFSISGIRPGRYYVRISYLGYAPRIVGGIEVAAAPIALGELALSADAVRGREVSVTAQRDFMTVEIDRTSYRAADMPVAAGGSATDVLRNIPAIEVDVDGNVSLRGNQNVVVLINGRTLSMTGDALTSFLQSLPANSIDRVEVIPNPSAKYDPDGMSGIINIVLKEQGSRGLSGGANVGVGTQDSYSAGVNLAYGSGPWSLYGNYGFNTSGRDFTGTRTQLNRIAALPPRMDQTSSEGHDWLGHVVNASAEYLFDPQSSLALTTIFNARSGSNGGTSRYFERGGGGELTDRYDRTSDGSFGGDGMDYRLSYRWVGEASKHEFSVEARYAQQIDAEDAGYTQQERQLDESPMNATPGRQNVRREDTDRNPSLQIDYARPIGEAGRLETGYKGEIEWIGGSLFSESFDYGSSAFQPDVALNNSFTYDRRIHALYGIYAHDFGSVGVQVGARVEQALTTFELETTGQAFDNDYVSVFPSAFVTYKPSDAINLKASYSRRIDRPWTGMLNPFVSQDDPTFRQVGNPHIKPEYIYAVELSVNHFTDLTSLSVTPYYRRTTDVIRRYGDLDSTTGVGTVTFMNFDESTSIGADVVASLRLGERYNVFASMSIYQMTTDASNVEEGLSADALGYNARLNATIGLLEGMDMQVTWFYRSPWALEGGGEVAPMQSADVALTQKLLGNALRLGLRVSDVFNQRGFSVTRNDPDFDLSFSRKPSSRTLMLTASYTFGTPDRKRRPVAAPSGPEMDTGW